MLFLELIILNQLFVFQYLTHRNFIVRYRGLLWVLFPVIHFTDMF